MMRTLLLLLLILSQFQLYSQKLSATFGSEVENNSNTKFTKVVSEDTRGVYMLREKGDDYYFEKYSVKLSLEKNVLIVLPVNEKKVHDFKNVFVIKGDFCVFTSYFDKVKQQDVLYRSKLDINTGALSGMVEVLTFSCAKQPGDIYSFFFSPDSSKILVSKKMSDKYGEPEKFRYKVFDASFKLVWEKDITYSYLNSSGLDHNIRIDTKGNLYRLARIKDDPKDQNEITHFELLSYDYVSGTLEKNIIKLTDQELVGVDIRINKDDLLIGGGFYADRKTFNLKGAFYFTLEINNNAFGMDKAPFSEDFFVKCNKGSQIADPLVEVSGYRLRNMFVTSDKLILVAEYYFVWRGGSKGVDWHYADVLITEINLKDGKNICGLIEKSQTCGSSAGSSNEDDFSANIHEARLLGIAVIFNGEKVGVIYNTTPEILEGKPDRVSDWTLLKSITILAVLEPDGTIEKTKLFEIRNKEENQKAYTIPRLYAQTTETSVIIMAEGATTYRSTRVGM